jgi:hypothetical protein
LAASESDPEPLRNGLDRPLSGTDNGWTGAVGAWVQYSLVDRQSIRELRLVCDSDLNRPGHNAVSNYPLNLDANHVPPAMLRAWRVEALDAAGQWQVIVRQENNYQRLVRLKVDIVTRTVRIIPEATWGDARVHLFAWDIR